MSSNPNRVSQMARPPAVIVNHVLNEDEIRRRYTIDMRGKAYLQVAGRILLFRMAHRLGQIYTEKLENTETGVLFRASVSTEDGKILATGYGHAITAGSQNYGGRIFEKAETAAIGRALAAAGFGTDAAGEDLDELDESDGNPGHLADSPVGTN